MCSAHCTYLHGVAVHWFQVSRKAIFDWFLFHFISVSIRIDPVVWSRPTECKSQFHYILIFIILFIVIVWVCLCREFVICCLLCCSFISFYSFAITFPCHIDGRHFSRSRSIFSSADDTSKDTFSGVQSNVCRLAFFHLPLIWFWIRRWGIAGIIRQKYLAIMNAMLDRMIWLSCRSQTQAIFLIQMKRAPVNSEFGNFEIRRRFLFIDWNYSESHLLFSSILFYFGNCDAN